MNIQHYKLNLDLLKNTSTPILYSHQLDKKSRFIDVTLTANDAEVTLDSTMTAVLNAVTNNVIVASAQSCTISDNVIVVELTDNVLSLPGITKCEVVLSDSSGAVITAQHFIVKVTEKAINSKSVFTPGGSNLITEAEVREILNNYYSSSDVDSLIDDIDETYAIKINLKADKDSLDNAVTQLNKSIDDNRTETDESIAVLTQTVADAKTYATKALGDKLNKMPFDTEPTQNSPNYVTSGTVYGSLNTLKAEVNRSLSVKYDSSNIESGTGTLTPSQTIYEGNEGSFSYVKSGKIVTVSVNITKLVADKTYIQMSGLPFPAKTESRFSSIAVYSTTSKPRNIRLDGSWLYISSTSDKPTTADEKLNFTITYIRR